MPDSPATELREAAAKLRAQATAASTDDDGKPTARWHTELDEFQGANQVTYRHGLLFGDYLTRDDGPRISWPPLVRGGTPARPPYMRTQHAEYAATMGPAVGLALADWLDQAAHHYECGIRAANDVFHDDPTGRDAFLTTGPGAPSAHALAVARQILGTTP